MPNYQNGKIYSIRSHQTDDIYIGSSTNPISKRFSTHKSKYNNWINDLHRYVSSFELFKYDDVYYELIECFPCNSKEELHKREGEIIRETENCVNKRIAGRTKKQYREDNREVIKEKKKQYREDNREMVLLKKKQYYENNKNVILSQQKEHRDENPEHYKLKSKKYREDNKEVIKERFKKYCEDNKEKLKEMKAVKYTCECGVTSIKYNKPRHERSKKHQDWLNSQ